MLRNAARVPGKNVPAVARAPHRYIDKNARYAQDESMDIFVFNERRVDGTRADTGLRVYTHCMRICSG
jgi:hypothetical protein